MSDTQRCAQHEALLSLLPDALYVKYGVNVWGWKKLLYQNVIWHWINQNPATIRAGS